MFKHAHERKMEDFSVGQPDCRDGTHDIDEALYLADRLILMTDGPAARVGEIVDIPFPRPRRRPAVLSHPRYHESRRHVIEFLERHAHQSRSAQ